MSIDLILTEKAQENGFPGVSAIFYPRWTATPGNPFSWAFSVKIRSMLISLTVPSSFHSLSAFQILFDKKRAVGVLFNYQGKDQTVRARKEVILSAGTVGSTKLLLLSGVGPRNHLQSLKVYCVYLVIFH